MGSVLVAGHNPLGAFVFRADHAAASLLFKGATPLACEEEAEMVDVLDACDEREDAELVRWTLLRGMNMALLPLGTLSALHACRLIFWKLTGGATAVIGEVSGVESSG
jgi:hypothetical protein